MDLGLFNIASSIALIVKRRINKLYDIK